MPIPSHEPTPPARGACSWTSTGASRSRGWPKPTGPSSIWASERQRARFPHWSGRRTPERSGPRSFSPTIRNAPRSGAATGIARSAAASDSETRPPSRGARRRLPDRQDRREPACQARAAKRTGMHDLDGAAAVDEDRRGQTDQLKAPARTPARVEQHGKLHSIPVRKGLNVLRAQLLVPLIHGDDLETRVTVFPVRRHQFRKLVPAGWTPGAPERDRKSVV